MLIGYARISKADGSQSLDLQRDALREAGVSDDAIYKDQASGQREDRPVLAGQGASIDTTTASGKLVFALFAALAEFERELIRERTLAGLAAAGGRPHALSKAQVRLARQRWRTRRRSASS